MQFPGRDERWTRHLEAFIISCGGGLSGNKIGRDEGSRKKGGQSEAGSRPHREDGGQME